MFIDVLLNCVLMRVWVRFDFVAWVFGCYVVLVLCL